MAGIRDMYRKRRDAFVEGTRKLGWNVTAPEAGLYIWYPVPRRGATSMEFAEAALEAGVIMLPGSGFGAAAEGYMRVALTVTEDRIREAVRRLAAVRL
jgi:LL-diaminopimelate aminotransferase